jgi:hypothetical protein
VHPVRFLRRNIVLDFNRPSGVAAAPAAVASKADLPKATAWLNVGYTVQVTLSDGTVEDRFVSIPVGIPLDTMEPIKITSRNVEYAQFQAAQNDLLEQLKAHAAKAAPGDAMIIPLEIQLRRVNGPATVPAADETNPFAAKLTLG